MEEVCKDFPDDIVYVMSDVNAYYEKLGYETEGTIFIVKPLEFSGGIIYPMRAYL